MKVKVNYNTLYELYRYMEQKYGELENDYKDLQIIIENLVNCLQGSAQESIASRMKNFNECSIKGTAIYTQELSKCIRKAAVGYQKNDDDFCNEIKKHVALYNKVPAGTMGTITNFNTKFNQSL